MKKEIFLHIGTHKTGTTSLQYYLDKHSEELLKKGIYYPRTGWYHHSQHELAFSLQKMFKNKDSLQNDSLWNTLKEEINNSSVPKIVISSEEFSLISEEAIIKLQDILKEYNVKIVIYIRRQSDLLESIYNQQTKDWKSPRKLPFEYFVKQPRKLYNHIYYFWMIKSWEDVFGIENMIVRIYNKKMLNGGNTLSDFFSLLDIPYDEEKINIRVNQSVSIKALEMIRLSKMMNIDLYKRKKIFELANYYFPADEKNTSLLTSLEKKALDEKFKKNNEKLKEKYFPNLDRNTLFSSEYYSSEKKDILSRIDLMHIIKDFV